MSECDCGAEISGKWADKHSSGCAIFAAEPTIAEIARLIGRSPTDLCDDGCDASCRTDGGTCICEEMHSTAATAIVTRYRKYLNAIAERSPLPPPEDKLMPNDRGEQFVPIDDDVF